MCYNWFRYAQLRYTWFLFHWNHVIPLSVIPNSVIPDSTFACYNRFRYARFPVPPSHLPGAFCGLTMPISGKRGSPLPPPSSIDSTLSTPPRSGSLTTWWEFQRIFWWRQGMRMRWVERKNISSSGLEYQTNTVYFRFSFELHSQRLNLPRYQTKQIYNLGKRRPSHDELVEPYLEQCFAAGRSFSANFGTLQGLYQRKVSTSSSSLTTPDIFTLLEQMESSGYSLQMGLWYPDFQQEVTEWQTKM